MNNNLFEIYGESHTRFIGMTFNYAKVGTKLNIEQIYIELLNRQGLIEINTARREIENIIFLSGVENNIITKSRISFVLENKNYRVRDYQFGIVRPSHVDIVGYQLYKTKFSYQGGGAFSGRLTALKVVLGQMCLQMATDDFVVQGQIKQVAGIKDHDLRNQKLKNLNLNPKFPVIDQVISQKMQTYIKEVKNNGDSQGAKLAYIISGLPVGIGGMYQDSFESILSSNLFAIGGVKGIDFGCGNEYIHKVGSEVNDEYYVEDGKIYSNSNYQGGINGGYTNGIQDVYFEVIVRPTPTIFKKQHTIKMDEDETWHNYEHQARGRHDAFIANRVQVVIKNMIYVSIYQMRLKGEK